MKTKTIETRWNECKKYLHIIHFALSLSSEPLSEGEFKYVEKNLITVFFNPKITIRFFHESHNTVLFGGLFTLKQWIISSLKHDTVPRVNKLYCFYVKNPPKRIALWDRENSQ